MKKTAHYIKIQLAMLFTFAVLGISFFTGVQSVFAASPGCYKINNGQPEKLSSCPTTNVTYDNGRGANPSSADPAKCYVYAANLYDGSSAYGDPYLEVPCNKLNPCPAGQESRYNADASSAPVCVATTAPTTGTYEPPTTPAQVDSTVNPLGSLKASSPDANELLAAKHTKTCGSGSGNEVKVAFDFGCLGPSYGKPLNPIVDIAFAIFRFLSVGVGLIVIGSMIVAGIQYSASRGNPQATEASIKRITNSIIALLLYIFMFAIANFLVPGGMLIK